MHPIKKRKQKLLSVLLTFTILCSVSMVMPVSAKSLNQTDQETLLFDSLSKASDPDTSGEKKYFSQSTLENGRLWTDKSVNAEELIIYDADGTEAINKKTKEDEFLITLSAMSQSYGLDTITEPSDTVFILDVSGSMYSNTLDNGRTRAAEMVDALNEAIQILMDANPNNRIAVVAYGGHVVGSGNGTRICRMLKLGHYQVDDGKYFSMTAANRVSINSQIPDADLIDKSTRTVTVEGGTPTQRGIYAGAQVLMNNKDTMHTTVSKGESINMIRKPNLILLSDGEPTFGWTNYKVEGDDTDTAHNLGNGSAVDLGLDTLAVLTASYWKQQVRDHYYPQNSEKTAGFYTIGLDIGGVHAPAVLNPKEFADQVTRVHSGTEYNMKTVLDDFIEKPASQTITFPAVTKNSTTRNLITVQNTDNYVKGYDYTDGYYPAKRAADLEDAFLSIAQKIITKGNYPTYVAPDSEPDFDGYLIFSDVLGKYMELKDNEGFNLLYDHNLYDGRIFAQSIVTDKNMQETYIKDMVNQQDFMTPPMAKSLLESCIAAGKQGSKDGLFYNKDTDFSNKIRYYADNDRVHIGNYFSPQGDVLPPPKNATCLIDLYTMAGETTNPVTTEKADLMKISLHLITVIEDGEFSSIEADDDQITRYLIKGQQAVRWYIPASLIPLRLVEPKFDENSGKVENLEIKEAAPVRMVYAVGLQEELDADKIDEQYKQEHTIKNQQKQENTTGKKDTPAYRFYTNAWEGVPNNYTIAYFHPSDVNPYYFYTEAQANEKGHIPLHTKSSGKFAPATSYKADQTYYTKNELFDAKEEGFIKEGYDTVDEEVTKISNKAGVPYVEIGETKKEAFRGRLKEKNITKTNDHIADKSAYTIDGQYLQLHLLGNNGMLDLPFVPADEETPPGNTKPPTDEPEPPHGNNKPPTDESEPPHGNNKPPTDNQKPPANDNDVPEPTPSAATSNPEMGDVSKSPLLLLLLFSGILLTAGILLGRKDKDL